MRTVISKDGTPIAFDQSGQGPALILVGGAMTTRLDEASLAAALASLTDTFEKTCVHWGRDQLQRVRDLSLHP